MKINKDTLKLTYEYLTQLYPFNKWNLPDSSQVIFKVINDDEVLGLYEPEPDCISISKARHDHLDTIIKTMAHEMCHFKLYINNKTYENHNSEFKKLTKQVATEFGFDPKEL